MGMLGALLLFGSCGSKEIREFFSGKVGAGQVVFMGHS